MEALLDGLERQVDNGMVSINGACQRLNAQLQGATLDDIKALQSLLPRLLNIIIYPSDFSSSNKSASWLCRVSNQSDAQAICNLFHPSGSLFTLIISNNNARSNFEISEEKLPFPVKRHLDSTSGGPQDKRKALIPLYRDRLIWIAGEQGKSGKWIMRLDMAEYFLFYLIDLTFLPLVSIQDSAITNWGWLRGDRKSNRQVVINDLINLPDSGVLYCHFNSSLASDVYQQLLADFLVYLLPLSKPQNSSIYSLLNSRSISPAQAFRLSEFWLSFYVEMHLNQYCYDLNPFGRPCSIPPFPSPPSLDRTLSLLRLCDHLTAAYYTPAANHAVQGLIEAWVGPYRVYLYRHCRLLAANWPLDSTFSLFMELWMTGAFPWRIVKDLPDFDDNSAIMKMVQQDFYFYSTIFSDLMGVLMTLFESWSDLDAKSIDLQAFNGQVGPISGAFLDCLLNLERIWSVLKTFQTEYDMAWNRSAQGKQVASQLAAREPISRFNQFNITGNGRDRAAHLISLIEQCKQLVMHDDHVDPGIDNTISWLTEISKNLQSLFNVQITSIPKPIFTESTNSHPTKRMIMASPKDRFVFNTKFSSDLPKRNEIAFLVPPLKKASDRLDRAFHDSLKKIPIIYTFFQTIHINLRFLAIPGYLIIIILMLFSAMYTVYRMIKRVF